MQQRYYDPIIGRFYSNDPVGFTANNPMLFNRYAYANNNPYKFVDPDGKFPRNSSDMARYRSMGQMQQAQQQIRQAQSHANDIMAPNDPAGVALGGVGVVASGVAASTVVGTGPGAVGLFLSLDGIRSSWTGGRTLTGMGLEAGATSLGLEREDIARAGKFGDLVQGASSGGAKSLHNAARSIGNVGDGAQATLLLRDTANMAGGVQVYSVNGRIDSAKLAESLDKKE